LTRERLSRVLARTPLTPWIARGLRARLVEEPIRFFVRDTRGRGTYAYSVRGSGARVVVEHGTPDVLTLDELWYTKVYEPPTAVEPLLSSFAPGFRLIDLGANVGMFVAWCVDRGMRPAVSAYEADPRNVAALERTLAMNADRLSDRRVWRGVAGTMDGSVRFVAGSYTTSHVAAGDEAAAHGAISVPAYDVLPALKECDFLKMDIEGGEWDILGDERFESCTARVIVMEVHPAEQQDGDYIEAAVSRLGAVGYETETTYVSPSEAATVWAWRTAPQPSTG
jgi:FkbM family methyltransferase